MDEISGKFKNTWLYYVCLKYKFDINHVILQAKFPLKTKSTSESNKRKSNFVKAHEAIEKHNSNKNSTFEMEHNKFSVMVLMRLHFLNIGLLGFKYRILN